MNTDKVNKSIKEANKLFIMAVIESFEGDFVPTDEEIFNALPDMQYSAMITGWLLAKGLYTPGTNVDKDYCLNIK